MLKNQVAVVTGSSQGLGRALALALAKAGAKVVVNARTAADVDKVVAEIKQQGGEAVPNYDSVATFDGGAGVIRTAMDSFGRIDILINNAGIQRVATIYDASEKDWDELVSINLKGSFNCSRHAAPLMKERGYGRIINIFSICIFRPFPGRLPYHAAKGGVWALTGAMAQELSPFGITVNAVSPGLTETRMTANLVAQFRSTEGITDPVLRKQLNAVIQPEEVAPFIVYLCSDAASGINGQTFWANGREISWFPSPEPRTSAYTAHQMWTLEELAEIFPRIFADAMSGGSLVDKSAAR
jgi:NAD(P)-dependent dehydrogenase (short-subunit alcohol dehydrogenase family)